MILANVISDFVNGEDIMKIYWGFAIGGSVIFALIALATLFGMGGAESGDVDVDMDGEIDIVHPDSGLFDFKLFSFRSILAFVAMFGWGGVVFGDKGWLGLAAATGCGLVTMVITAVLIRSILKLQQSGTRSNDTLIGKKGTVYLAIPAGGRGKVVLDLGDSTREVVAYSETELAKGAVVVTTELNAEVFTVKPI